VLVAYSGSAADHAESRVLDDKGGEAVFVIEPLGEPLFGLVPLAGVGPGSQHPHVRQHDLPQLSQRCGVRRCRPSHHERLRLCVVHTDDQASPFDRRLRVSRRSGYLTSRLVMDPTEMKIDQPCITP